MLRKPTLCSMSIRELRWLEGILWLRYKEDEIHYNKYTDAETIHNHSSLFHDWKTAEAVLCARLYEDEENEALVTTLAEKLGG